MRRTRRATAGIIAGVLALLPLTACSSESGEQADGGAMTVWFPGNIETEMELVKNTLVPAFERDTGIDVEVTYVDWPEVSPKLNAAFAAGTAPDVIGHGIAATADLAANERIEDLTPYAAKLSATDRKDLESALSGGKVDGKQYIMPLVATLKMIAYSGAAFRDAGLDPDAPPTTWEEVKTAAEKLTERKGGKITRSGLAMPSDPIGIQQSYATLLGSNGGAFLAPDGKKSAVGTPEAAEALQYFTSLYQGPTAVDGTLGEKWSDSPPEQQPITTGRAAMQLANGGDIARLQAVVKDQDLRLIPPPAFQGKQPKAFGGAANGLMINRDSDQKDEAWKFITYMLQSANSLKYAESLGALPVRASAVTSSYTESNPELKKAVAALPVNLPNPNVVGWVQMRDAMNKSLERSLHGQTSPEEALKQATTDMDKIIAAGG